MMCHDSKTPPVGAPADKRRFLIGSEIVLTVFAAISAVLVWFGLINPPILLLFTFVLGAGAAFTAPAWQSVVPQLVPKQDLAAAVTSNGVGVNISRAIGPALAADAEECIWPKVIFCGKVVMVVVKRPSRGRTRKPATSYSRAGPLIALNAVVRSSPPPLAPPSGGGTAPAVLAVRGSPALPVPRNHYPRGYPSPNLATESPVA
jgi:MFS family permease